MDSELSEFIWLEISKQRISQREFAERVGVSHTTIGRILRGEVTDPTLDFLVKLADATSTDICALVAMIRPDAFKGSAKAFIIAARIERLPETQRKIIELVLSGSEFEGINESIEGT